MKIDSYGQPMAFKAERLEPCINAQFVRAKSNPEVLGILVYGDIGFDVDGALFEGLMRKNAPFSAIELRINSMGGDAWTGIAIYNLLASSGYPITVYVDGLAASAASVIAMAGDEVVVYPSSSIMIHDARAMGFGTGAALREAAQRADAMTETMTEIYVEHTGKARGEVRAAMEEERYFKGSEAVAFGLATKLDAKQVKGKRTVASVRRWLDEVADPFLAEREGRQIAQSTV